MLQENILMTILKQLNKTEKIQACIGNIEFKSIHRMIGCSHSLVHNVFYSNYEEEKQETVEPTKKAKKRRAKRIIKPLELVFEKDMEVIIQGDPNSWIVDIVGRGFLSLVRGCRTCNVMKYKIVKVV